LFAVPAGATVWPDSLYIVKPGDSLQWGAKVIGGASVTRTVRLLNHSPDTLIGTVYSSNACYTLNGAVKDTLQYVIPDTTGVFEFTVTFTPAYRGVIDAWLYMSDPFDSVALSGLPRSATRCSRLMPTESRKLSTRAARFPSFCTTVRRWMRYRSAVSARTLRL
jgi:hypothetical protein